MGKIVAVIGAGLLALAVSEAYSQEGNSDLNIFGYFQANLNRTSSIPGHAPRMSFAADIDRWQSAPARACAASIGNIPQ